MLFGMGISSNSEWRRSACRAESCGPRAAFGIGGTFAHTDHAVDLAALMDQQPARGDVAVHYTRGLDLDALLGVNAAADFPADDRFPRHHVALDRAAFRHQHLATRADSPNDRALHLHYAFGRDVTDDTHPGPDDRQAGFRVALAVAFFREERHVSCPPSPA